MHKWWIFALLAVFLLVMLSSCMPTEESSPELANTATFTLTNTATSTPTLTKTPIPTWTAEPSFAEMPEGFQAQIEELLLTNGNCDYPCWWGLTPGKTKFVDARKFIEPLSISSGILETYPDVFSASIAIPDVTSSAGKLNFEMIQDMKGYIKVIVVYGYDISMSDLLQMFGEPSEIYYYGPLYYPNNYIEISFDLFYPSTGIIVGYDSVTHAVDSEGMIMVCDLDTHGGPYDFVGFNFWNSEIGLTYNEIMDLSFPGVDLPPYSEIGKISNMDTHTFYLNFSQPNPECLEIDIDLYSAEVWSEDN